MHFVLVFITLALYLITSKVFMLIFVVLPLCLVGCVDIDPKMTNVEVALTKFSWVCRY